MISFVNFILTMEEDGTINHTCDPLVDANGRWLTAKKALPGLPKILWRQRQSSCKNDSSLRKSITLTHFEIIYG